MKKICLLFILGLVFHFAAYCQEVPQKQQIVITKIAATWCPNCGTAAWDNFTTIHDEYDGKAVILNVHPSGSSKLHSTESREFSSNLPQAFGQPLFYVNKQKHSTGSIVDDAGQAINDASAAAPVANTGVIASIKGSDLEVTAKVKFFKEGDGDYYLSLLIVEDGVIADQASRGSNVSHKKILRSSFTGGTFGQPVANGSITADTEFSFKDFKPIDGSWNTDNLEVTAILWKKVGNDYEFVNANSVDASFSTSVNFLEKTGVKLAITPTLVQETATVTVETPINLNKVNLAIFNTAGQQVATVFAGTMQNGLRNFTIKKSDLKSSGVYFLQMEVDGSVISRKLVVE